MTRWLGQGCQRHPRLTSTKRLGEAPPTPLGRRPSRPSPPLASRAGGGKCAPPTFDVRRPLLGEDGEVRRRRSPAGSAYGRVRPPLRGGTNAFAGRVGPPPQGGRGGAHARRCV